MRDMIPPKQFALIGMTTLLVAACTSAPVGSGTGTSGASTVSHGGPVQDLASLIDHLSGNGFTVTPGESISQPFFSVKGQQTMVGTETIQIYEYANAQSMEADASKISPNGGSIGTSMMSWIGPPHFFKKGRILVLFIGSDRKTLDALTSAMRQQFAGR